MPYAARKEDALFGTRDEARFVHYTTSEAALSIIKSKRIWMRNTTCMSDYREVQHGFDILNKFFSDEAKRREFFQALDMCSSNVGMDAINLFNQGWRDTRFNTYLSSISVHADREDLHGRLSMWRGFGGGNVARVAMVLRIPRFAPGSPGLNLILSPVGYLQEEEVHAEIGAICQNIRANCDFLRTVDRSLLVWFVFTMLVAGVVCLKHEGFHEEREWRLIYEPKRSPSPFMESSTEIIGGVPQIVYKVPLDVTVSDTLAEVDLSRLFDRLIIGPSPYPWAMYEAFVAELTKSGIPNPQDRVFISGIPIRT
jgi:hypothetical protein